MSCTIDTQKLDTGTVYTIDKNGTIIFNLDELDVGSEESRNKFFSTFVIAVSKCLRNKETGNTVLDIETIKSIKIKESVSKELQIIIQACIDTLLGSISIKSTSAE